MSSFIRATAVVIVLGAVALGLAGCEADTAEQDTTNTIVNISSLVGLAGGETPNEGEGLNSDVCDGTGCTVINDAAQVTFLAITKDITRPAGQFQDVVFNRYRVTYIRADGRNTPGVDVPHPFDGAVSVLVPLNTFTSVTVTVVRVQAKLEEPLVSLAFGGGAIAISAIAEIEFFGRDVAGRDISVKGTLNITFADFADEE